MQAQGEFRDFSVGLILFGVLELLIALCLVGMTLLIPLAALGASMAPSGSQVTLTPAMMWMSGLMYAALAAFFGVMGVGSILGRRWARALMLVASWIWLVVGLMSVVQWIFMLPRFGEMMAASSPQPLPEGAAAFAACFASVLMLFLYVLLPLAFVLFYGSRHTRLTCEWKDPQQRWTDRTPLPVVAVSFLQGFGALALLFMAAFIQIFPIFGWTLRGAPAVAAIVGMACVWAALAWGFYRLRPAAWWGTVAMLLLGAVSSALTLPRLDFADVYRQMGYPEQQIERLMKFSVMSPTHLTVQTLVTMALYLGCVLYLRRYFKRGSP